MLGQELRKARLAAKFTQEQLALQAHVDRSYLSELERNLKSPTVAMLQHLCDVMGVSAGELVSRSEAARLKAKHK
jgi:transcriptional regulator with XRE-family HTH domain